MESRSVSIFVDYWFFSFARHINNLELQIYCNPTFLKLYIYYPEKKKAPKGADF